MYNTGRYMIIIFSPVIPIINRNSQKKIGMREAGRRRRRIIIIEYILKQEKKKKNRRKKQALKIKH